MKEELRTSLNDPRQLEKLYRTNRVQFKREFGVLYPELRGNLLAECWNERLQYEQDELHWGSRRELLFVLAGALLAGFFAKLPALFSISEDFFYPRNLGFILFPVLTAYFAWKNTLSAATSALLAGLSLLALLFINTLPALEASDTTALACIHVLLFLWALLGVAFVGGPRNRLQERLGYLKYNGDLLVMSALLLIAGGILTGITIGLFSLIGWHIEAFYFQNIVIFGLPAVPIVGTYLIQTNPQLVGKVSPLIARLFSPLVLLMLVIYLLAMGYAGKDPYNDREFLLIFNALLIGVLAIIFFSVAETSGTSNSKTELWVLFLLSLVTIVVNGIALSAILFRISEWGITPNRLTVLGGNFLILINLLLVTVQLYRVLAKKDRSSEVGELIAFYLPVYGLWAIVVTFVFPFLFGFK